MSSSDATPTIPADAPVARFDRFLRRGFSYLLELVLLVTVAILAAEYLRGAPPATWHRLVFLGLIVTPIIAAVWATSSEDLFGFSWCLVRPIAGLLFLGVFMHYATLPPLWWIILEGLVAVSVLLLGTRFALAQARTTNPTATPAIDTDAESHRFPDKLPPVLENPVTDFTDYERWFAAATDRIRYRAAAKEHKELRESLKPDFPDESDAGKRATEVLIERDPQHATVHRAVGRDFLASLKKKTQ